MIRRPPISTRTDTLSLHDALPIYEARKGFVVDSRGVFSQQIDVIIHDRQYSPFVFTFKGTDVVPAESVYAVFEAKQELTAAYIRYAGEKAASVRRLHRTSLYAETIDVPSRAKPLHQNRKRTRRNSSH